MTSPTEEANVTTPLGVMGMFGGALFPVLYVGLVALSPDEATYATGLTFTGAAAIPVLFWLPATVGLAYRHRATFGVVGWVGTVALVGALVTSLLDNLWLLATQDALLTGTAGLAALVVQAAGALLFGGTIAHRRELPNAVPAGLLLALGLPVGVGGALLLPEVVALSPVVAVAVVTVPYGAGWLGLGYDLASEPDRLDPATALTDDRANDGADD